MQNCARAVTAATQAAEVSSVFYLQPSAGQGAGTKVDLPFSILA